MYVESYILRGSKNQAAKLGTAGPRSQIESPGTHSYTQMWKQKSEPTYIREARLDSQRKEQCAPDYSKVKDLERENNIMAAF